MYCEKCGQPINSNMTFCPSCDTPIKNSYAPNTFDNDSINSDKPSFWFSIIGFLIPIVGLVLFFVYRDKQPKKAKSAGKGALTNVFINVIISIVILVFNLIGVSFVKDNVPEFKAILTSNYSDLSEESSTQEILDEYVDVSFGEFTETSVSVIVKNKAEQKSTFSITIEAVDDSGARIATDIIYADGLNPNQEITLEAFEYVPKSDIDKYSNATFKVLEITRYDF